MATCWFSLYHQCQLILYKKGWSFFKGKISLRNSFPMKRGKISEKELFFGYDLFLWYLVVLNATASTGRLLVAVVIKYADNILKGFACSLAIIITCFVSVLLFGFQLSIQFFCGSCICYYVHLYVWLPTSQKDSKKQRNNRSLIFFGC